MDTHLAIVFILIGTIASGNGAIAQSSSQPLSQQLQKAASSDDGAINTPAQKHMIMNPKPTVTPGVPVYPRGAEKAGVQGYVDISFTIEQNGSVGAPKVEAEVPQGYGFADAAMNVFPHWTFKPPEVDGKIVSAPAIIRLQFKLPKYSPKNR